MTVDEAAIADHFDVGAARNAGSRAAVVAYMANRLRLAETLGGDVVVRSLDALIQHGDGREEASGSDRPAPPRTGS